MNYRVMCISVLLFVAVACDAAGGAPALILENEPFHSWAGGYSIRYPRGWQHLYLERVGGEVFHDSRSPIQEIVALRAVAKVPVVVVIAGPLDTIPYVSPDGIQDSKSMLGAFLAWIGDAPEAKMSRVRAVTVSGRNAAAADIRWSQEEAGLAGRAVAVHLGDRGFFIEAAGRAEDWKAFAPTFEAILESVTFD